MWPVRPAFAGTDSTSGTATLPGFAQSTALQSFFDPVGTLPVDVLPELALLPALPDESELASDFEPLSDSPDSSSESLVVRSLQPSNEKPTTTSAVASSRVRMGASTYPCTPAPELYEVVCQKYEVTSTMRSLLTVTAA